MSVYAGAQPEICNGGCFGSLGVEPPAIGGNWGCGVGAPSARKLCIFSAKIIIIFGLFWYILMLLKRGIEQCKNMIILVA